MSHFIKCAVIGHPIGHSKSPLIHNYWIKKYGLSGEYKSIDVAPDDLKTVVQKLIAEGYRGFNVTVPHKESVYNLCDELDAEAVAIGAVNTVIINSGPLSLSGLAPLLSLSPLGGRGTKGEGVKSSATVLGLNTDAFGFIENIRENIKQNSPGFDFGGGGALVLGAGGAARAIVHGLLRAGVPRIYIANRTRTRAEILAESFKNVVAIDWAEHANILPEVNILINATSLGMIGNLPLEINLSRLSKSALVTDIVYKPLETDLLQQARARGNKTVTGIGMLLHQARPAFKAWFGVMPDVDDDLIKMVTA